MSLLPWGPSLRASLTALTDMYELVILHLLGEDTLMTLGPNSGVGLLLREQEYFGYLTMSLEVC